MFGARPHSGKLAMKIHADQKQGEEMQRNYQPERLKDMKVIDNDTENDAMQQTAFPPDFAPYRGFGKNENEGNKVDRQRKNPQQRARSDICSDMRGDCQHGAAGNESEKDPHQGVSEWRPAGAGILVRRLRIFSSVNTADTERYHENLKQIKG